VSEHEPWVVEFYQDRRGRRPVADFIRDLEPKMQAKVLRSLDLLGQFGDRLPMPLARPVTGFRFSELRVQFGGNIARIFYLAASGRRIVLLHGFVKKSQQTPRRELEIASSRRDELLTRLT
jgi:phage-related protein